MAKISAASARSHTRKKNSSKSTSFLPKGIFKKLLLVLFTGFLAWAYQATRPPPPKICGSPDGPPITSPRIKLRDGRHLSYLEYGAPKESAKYKIIFVHAFDNSRHHNVIAGAASPDLIKDLGVYTVAFDRPGYGESDPDPKRTLKSLALDIEELADQLELGSKFYLVGMSFGGVLVWPVLKYIPHRLAGAALIAPVVNHWWPSFPSNISNEVYSEMFMQDQWVLRVAHHLPWLTYWWNTQKWFPSSSDASQSLTMEVLSKLKVQTEAQKRYTNGSNCCSIEMKKCLIMDEGNEGVLRTIYNERSRMEEIISSVGDFRPVTTPHLSGCGLYATSRKPPSV